jgi:hypothetical protein
LGLPLIACSSGDKDANDPSGVASSARDTELVHEKCDLTASGAKGTDANGDRRNDIIKVYDGARELCRAVDINMDSIVDVFVYFDDAGRVRRRESGFDRDTQPDEIGYYENGQLVRKERETNNDRKVDTWSYFEGGRLVREERDSSGDGYVDQWWVFDRPAQPECAVVVSDEDGDGQPDKESTIDTCAPTGKEKEAKDNAQEAPAPETKPAAPVEMAPPEAAEEGS